MQAAQVKHELAFDLANLIRATISAADVSTTFILLRKGGQVGSEKNIHVIHTTGGSLWRISDAGGYIRGRTSVIDDIRYVTTNTTHPNYFPRIQPVRDVHECPLVMLGSKHHSRKVELSKAAHRGTQCCELGRNRKRKNVNHSQL